MWNVFTYSMFLSMLLGCKSLWIDEARQGQLKGITCHWKRDNHSFTPSKDVKNFIYLFIEVKGDNYYDE